MLHHATQVPLHPTVVAHQTKLLVCNIAYLLKFTRLMLRLSLDEAEALIGMKENTLWRIESGGQCFTIKTIMPILLAYGLSYSQVFRHYTKLPTASEWKKLAKMQKQLVRYKKSKKKRKPQTGVQLVLLF